ncbi:patatin-like phospholipase family protein [Aquimonas voraii]|uniref:NTE family protein n=1 Tax=Aquimonas voraii TaxID=265719 RepID=A0A1G6RUD5_9GAMM|nr:patatin-like phospholipase family protein [Aquimonas voraii]SDD08168.1 NTE family protein [Aquimonas voraii]
MSAKPRARRINLALQGGGAHGAFTWGVLDALLEDGRIEFEGLSGTSAGAMNAAVLADGLLRGGIDGAREALDGFWSDVAASGLLFSPTRPTLPLPPAFESWARSVGFAAFETWTRLLSPYQFNPFDFNPLREVLGRRIDFEALRAPGCLRLFVGATAVRSGRVKVFHNAEMSVDALLASTCLPQLFQAVEIDGEPYWDGGYMGNPVLFPLFYETASPDILIVHINPIVREQTPRSPMEIANRVNEISFNASLMREMRAVAFVAKLKDEGWLKPEFEDRLKRIHLHAIRADALMATLDVSSKLSPDRRFLLGLRDSGRQVAREWLEANFEALGVRDSVDVRSEYL